MEILAAADGEFYVAPSIWLIAFTALVLLALPCAVVTALKGRWGWFVVGVLTGFTFLVSAFLPALPDSAWARRAARRDATRVS